MNRLKKRPISTIGILSIGIIALALVFNLTVARIDLNMQHELLSSYSPDYKYEVFVRYKDSIFFGPSDIFIYYKKKSEIFRHKIISTEIANDGKDISKRNCTILWNDLKAIIILSGDEQKDEIIAVDFSNEVEVRRLSGK